jgi:hypothetical protein
MFHQNHKKSRFCHTRWRHLDAAYLMVGLPYYINKADSESQHFHKAGLGHRDEVASGGSIAYNGTKATQGSFHIDVGLCGEVENTHRHHN